MEFNTYNTQNKLQKYLTNLILLESSLCIFFAVFLRIDSLELTLNFFSNLPVYVAKFKIEKLPINFKKSN
jgi:hypothetical protein